MAGPTIRTAGADGERAAIDAIVMGFSTDPVARWCWPGPHQYLTNMPRFTRVFAGAAFAHGTVHCSDDHIGAAVWLRPGAHPDEELLGDLVQRSTSASIREDLLTILDRMAAHHPGEPHWYLPLIGVDPAHQGKGHGTALLRHALETCDRDHMPAYLESTNPRNISLYERHGFEAIGRIQVGTSPPIVPMVRWSR